MGRWCVRYGRIGGRREKVWGVYRFSSLVKQNKKAKIYAVFCFAGFFFFKKFCYEVIVKQKKKTLLITTDSGGRVLRETTS